MPVAYHLTLRTLCIIVGRRPGEVKLMRSYRGRVQTFWASEQWVRIGR